MNGAAAQYDPFPAIPENAASGETAELFDDIRATLGVPVVNLIWRHLAILPGALGPAWLSVKPLYASGEVARLALALRNRIQVPEPSVAGAEMHYPPEDRAVIRTIFRSYERSNAMNLVGLGALLAMADGKEGASEAIGGLRRARLSDDTEEGEVLGRMPEPLTVAAMSPDAQPLALQLAPIGGGGDVMPTIYRHLAHWPGVLEQCLHVLLPLEQDGSLQCSISATLYDSQSIGRELMTTRKPGTEIAQGALSREATAAIQHFVDAMICKMVVIVAVLGKAFPQFSGPARQAVASSKPAPEDT